MEKFNRRDFIKLTGASIAAYTLPMSLNAADDLDGYKALVVVDLQGGNDALNMFIPADDRSGIYTGYRSYIHSKSADMTIKDVDLTGALSTSGGQLSLGKQDGNPYFENFNIANSYTKGFYIHGGAFQNKIATNAVMPEIAHLMNRGVGAIVHNVGNIKQSVTKSELRADPTLYPTAATSHADARLYIESGQANLVTFSTGWLGGLADRWGDINNSNIYRMNINLSKYGSKKMLFSHKSQALNFPNTGPLEFNGMGEQIQKKAYEGIVELSRRDLFKKLYNQRRKEALMESKMTTSDWREVTGDNDPFSNLTNAYGESLFNRTSIQNLGLSQQVYTHYIRDFEAAARLIAIGKRRGFKRQVIVISLGGWDTHTNQFLLHPRNLRGLSMGVGAFQTAIDSLGISNEVTLFSVSEFSRSTATNNTGTDHGWGGSQFVIGGAVKSGNYGRLPDLRIGGDEDYSTRGRLIPSISFSQYYATLTRWFGADEDTLDGILPELKNFTNRDLGFMKS